MPVEPERVAGRDDQPLLAVHEPDDRDVAAGEHAVDVGQRVLAGLGVEQMRAGEVAEPVAQRDSPPSDPTFDDASVTPGIGGRAARRRRGRARGRASRSRRSCGRSRRRPRSSATSTSSPAWWPSRPAGTTSRPSARTSEVSTPAPRGSGVATSPAPTRPRRTRTQSSMPIGEASLRASRARARGALGRRRALELGEQRRGEDVEGQRRGDGVARRAEHRRAVDRAEHDRMAGTHGDAVDGQRAGRSTTRGRVVVAARARARHHDDEIGAAGGRAHRGGDALRVVADDRRAPSPRSRPRAPARRASASWCRGSRPGAGSAPTGRISSPVGSTATTGAPVDGDLGGAGRGRGGDVDGAQAVPCGQQQLGRR